MRARRRLDGLPYTIPDTGLESRRLVKDRENRLASVEAVGVVAGETVQPGAGLAIDDLSDVLRVADRPPLANIQPLAQERLDASQYHPRLFERRRDNDDFSHTAPPAARGCPPHRSRTPA